MTTEETIDLSAHIRYDGKEYPVIISAKCRWEEDDAETGTQKGWAVIDGKIVSGPALANAFTNTISFTEGSGLIDCSLIMPSGHMMPAGVDWELKDSGLRFAWSLDDNQLTKITDEVNAIEDSDNG